MMGNDIIHPNLPVEIEMINVGIIGCGFVGGTLKAWLAESNRKCVRSVMGHNVSFMSEFLAERI